MAHMLLGFFLVFVIMKNLRTQTELINYEVIILHITSVCVCVYVCMCIVAFVIWHKNRVFSVLRCNVTCVLSDYTVLYYSRPDFLKKL